LQARLSDIFNEWFIMKEKLLLSLALISAACHASDFSSTEKKDVQLKSKPLKEIIGGSIAPRKEWAVYGGYGCSGSAISPNYILAARHCENGAIQGRTGWYYSTDNNNHISKVKELANINVPRVGDIVLLKLQNPHPLNDYAPIDLDYDPTYGDAGRIYGYGYHGKKDVVKDRSALYQANVEIHYRTPHWAAAGGGTTIKTSGIDGASSRGDSGGPLFAEAANNSVVGVASTGVGNDIHANDYYADLKQAKSFILEKTGEHVTDVVISSSAVYSYENGRAYKVAVQLSGQELADAQINLVASSSNNNFYVTQQPPVTQNPPGRMTRAITLLPDANGNVTFYVSAITLKNTIPKDGNLRIQAGKIFKNIPITQLFNEP
jgi:hypothetical protein